MKDWEDYVQTSLSGIAKKAKAQPDYRFRNLYGMLNEKLLADSWLGIEKSAASGVDGVSAGEFEENLEGNIGELVEDLKAKRYRAKLVRRKYIPKGQGKMRPLGIPATRDKLLQLAAARILRAIWEPEFMRCSYGYRPGVGARDAVSRLTVKLQFGRYNYVVEADIRGFFDTIPHQRLMERVREKVVDGRVIGLIESFLKQGVMDGLETWTSEEGTPQGAVISPLLANVYLNPLDHQMARKRYMMIRYADDLVILGRSRQEAEEALGELAKWTGEAGLKLHPVKTRIVEMSQAGAGFDFLGYHFLRTGRGRLMRCPRKKSLNRFKDAIRERTRRNNGHSLEHTIDDVNVVTRGWFEYFKHSNRTTFVTLDTWIRTRLHSILRKRQGRKGPARGPDHQRWPNKFFADRGLFSTFEAHVAACQSARR